MNLERKMIIDNLNKGLACEQIDFTYVRKLVDTLETLLIVEDLKTVL